MGRWIRTATAAVMALLAALAAVPGPAFADPVQFFLSGPITGIDSGKVKAAGKSGRFVVKERNVTGTLEGFIDDEPVSEQPFQFTFGTNVPLMTQSGNLHGVLSFGPYEAHVAAKSEIGLTPFVCAPPDGVTCIQTPAGNFRPGLIIDGVATFTHGATGHGTASASLVPRIDPNTGHIVEVIAGEITVSSP
jgi:hypothetical protein